MFRFAFFLVAAVPVCGAASAMAHIPLPADLSGVHNGTEYKIRVPANWNGTLLVYGHGASTSAVQVAPLAARPASPTLEELLLSRGYALAGSFYEDFMDEAVKRTLQLTNFFRGRVGNPQRTIVWGVSLGGDACLSLIEDHPGIYDGAIAIAPSAAGWVEYADFLLRYDLAYGAAFGWPSEWWGPIDDIRDDLAENVYTLIAPVFQWAGPHNYPQWEFVRLIMKQTATIWWEADPALGLPGYALAGWGATARRSALEEHYGGPVAENLGVFYTLTADEKAYLTTLGVDSDQLLGWMNLHTNIAARLSARRRLERDGSYSGLLRKPLLMVHGIHDPLVIVPNQAVYGALVRASGNADKLVQAYVTEPGHTPFSAEQFLSALEAMEHWLNTGNKPDASFFPANKGFDTTFVPPPWPY